jgi:uncharacterized protein (TIGR02266 family)
MSVKTILVAHRAAAVRDRFAAALADARHQFVTAADEGAARQAAADPGATVHVALVDLGLAADGTAVALVQALAVRPDGGPRPVVVFSGSLKSADIVRALAAARVAGYVNEFASTAQILRALAPHLFPDNFNRRATPRVPLEVPIAYRTGETIAAAVTMNIGGGGLAIRTMDALAAGTRLELTFRLPGLASDVETTARVVWSDQRLAVGVEFEALTPPVEHTIKALAG